MTATDACAKLKVHGMTLNSWKKQGFIEAFRDNQREWQYNVDRFLDETKTITIHKNDVLLFTAKRQTDGDGDVNDEQVVYIARKTA